MEEFERRRAKRKGYQDIGTMLQPSKAKSARTTEDEGLLAEDEMDLDSGDVNLNVGDCNANLGADVDLGENSLENDNLAGQGDEAKLGLGNECGAMIMEKLSELSISFNDVCTRLVAVENVLQDKKNMEIPGIAQPGDVEPEDERLYDLRKCASLQDVLELLPELEEEGDVIFCSLCLPREAIRQQQQASLRQQQQDGKFHISKLIECGAIDSDGKQTRAFLNFKGHVKRHIGSKPHTQQWNLWKEKEEKEERLRSKNETTGMRLGRIAYDGFLKGRSYRDFEDQVCLAVTNGLPMGDFHNSRAFPANFLPYVYDEVKLLCEQFLTKRTPETGFLPPVNVAADKGTAQHRSMQFTTATIALANNEHLLVNMFLGHPQVKDHSAEGLTNSIWEVLKESKIQASQVEGLSVDGQYIKYKVDKLLKEKMGLGDTFVASWDALHRYNTSLPFDRLLKLHFSGQG